MAPFNYAGEEFLSVRLPDYESERMMLVVKLVVAFVAWLVVMPVMMATPVEPDKKKEEEAEEAKTVVTTSKNGTQKITTTKVVHHKRGKKEKNGNRQSKKAEEEPKESKEDAQPVKEVSEMANILCIIGFLCTVCYMVAFSSPDNAYTTRGVFEAPLFTREECNFLIDMAETVAQRNYEAALNNNDAAFINEHNITEHKELLQMEPIGWQKKRHTNYATTDLNLVTDPFSKEDRQWIKEKLDARLAPTISRLYGVPQGALRANDIFVIRYDGDRQAALMPHTDDGDVTFSALLSDGFTGGGTNYYSRVKQYDYFGPLPYVPKPDEVFAHVLPEVGQMTLFRGPILHEGVQVKKGRRYLLIGFLNIDNVDPFRNHEPTGLSWFASWFSLNWAAVRFKMGYNTAILTVAKNEENKGNAWMLADYEDSRSSDWMSESPYFRGLIMQLHYYLTAVADLWSNHFFQSIIPANQTEPYLQKMDEAYARRRPSKLPSWFSGQQVELRVDGSFHSEWSTRERNSDKFGQTDL